MRESDEYLKERKIYNFDHSEHLIIASDWMHHLAEEDLPGQIARSLLTQSMLINGRGRFYNVSRL